MKERPICRPNINLSNQAMKCIMKPTVPNCVVKPVVKVALNPCVQEHVIYNGTQDPYIQNMPKDNIVDAVNYAAKMGGEHNKISGCEIM